eukprot:TRINITY_DN11390_c0_g1_i1.p1 TRINITY_DN11390_c0_g1~~TRINITY_DN11390_c0_g1_i1.p1  ORF type:complete len:481 (+),score=95.50 TRINITY_DN11390_c0_g1_i1:707-2149(+)
MLVKEGITYAILREGTESLYKIENQLSSPIVVSLLSDSSVKKEIKPQEVVDWKWPHAQQIEKLSVYVNGVSIPYNFTHMKEKIIKDKDIKFRTDFTGFTQKLIVSKSECKADYIPTEKATQNFDFSFSLSIHAISISLLDAKPQEFLHFYFKQIDFIQQVMESTSCRMELKILYAQLDNQLKYTKTPVVMFSSEKPLKKLHLRKVAQIAKQKKHKKTGDDEVNREKYFLHVDIKQDTTHVHMNTFQYISIQIQPLYIHLDTSLIIYMGSYTAWISELLGQKSQEITKQSLLSGEVPNLYEYSPKMVMKTRLMYIQHFSIGDMDVLFSFHARELCGEELPWKERGLRREVLKYAKVSLQKAHIMVTDTELHHVYSTPDKFTAELGEAYKKKLIGQMVIALGSIRTKKPKFSRDLKKRKKHEIAASVGIKAASAVAEVMGAPAHILSPHTKNCAEMVRPRLEFNEVGNFFIPEEGDRKEKNQ